MMMAAGCMLGLMSAATPAFAQHRGGGHAAHGYVAFHAYRAYGYPVVAPLHYGHPYYVFNPHVSVGFGIWAGYPIAYTYGFYDPFLYAAPYAYTAPYPYPYPLPAYPPQAYPPSNPSTGPQASAGSVAVQPGQENMGGLSFDITPSTAQVFIDGRLAGTVGQFTATTEPLGIPAGRHRLDVRAQGYQTLTVDVDIVAGQVIPYQGTLQKGK
jgi:hypothetical protein